MVATARLPLAEERVWNHESSTMKTLAAEALECVKDYAKDEPVKFALWAFGIGFVLGLRLKSW